MHLYIDSWEIISRTISFKYFGERHTGENIREKVMESLKSTKIDPMQVLIIFHTTSKLG